MATTKKPAAKKPTAKKPAVKKAAAPAKKPAAKKAAKPEVKRTPNAGFKEVNIMASNAKKDVVMHRSIEFVLEMPNAQKVILMGDFNKWNPKKHPMRMDKNGVWRETVKISPGRYEYRFWVDGEWYNDPHNTLRCPNCFGSENNVIEVMS